LRQTPARRVEQCSRTQIDNQRYVALAGEGREDAPTGGARLSRSSMVLRQSRVLPAVTPSVDAPSPDAVRRMSGAFPAVRS